MEEDPMRIFSWIAFLILIGVAIFAIQNSSAAPVMIKFLAWRFETSLVFTILGSIVLGCILTLFLWISRTIRHSFKKRGEGGQDHLEPSRFSTMVDRHG
jgi:uncharacterized integral membrane protein